MAGAYLVRLARWDGSAWSRENVSAPGSPIVAWYASGEAALAVAWWEEVPVGIRRGVAKGSLAPVATAPLPWTDPEPVRDPGYPEPLLFYDIQEPGRVALEKVGQSVRLRRL